MILSRGLAVGLVLSLVLFYSQVSRAEYRVFRMVITDSSNPVEIKKREFLTTLDPYQWVGYHPLKAAESLDYIDTWRCYEDTSDDEDFCPSPRAKTEEQNRIPAGPSVAP